MRMDRTQFEEYPARQFDPVWNPQGVQSNKIVSYVARNQSNEANSLFPSLQFPNPLQEIQIPIEFQYQSIRIKS